MTNTPIVFGNYDNLVGVVSEPTERPHRKTGVLMLTPGMLHHVGPFRLHVELANALSDIGIASIRFDLSGIGESLAVGSERSSLDRAADETRQAMDYLSTSRDINQFVLFGLCSGADDALYAALRDPRIIGLIMMDGFGYRTRRFYWQRLIKHYPRRLVSLPKWKNFLANKMGRSQLVPNSLQVGDDIREFPERDEAANQLRRLIERDVQLRLIYTGGVGAYYNYADQYKDMFRDVKFEENVSSRFFSSMDHVAILREDRDLLVDDVVHWINRSFDASADMPASRQTAFATAGC